MGLENCVYISFVEDTLHLVAFFSKNFKIEGLTPKKILFNYNSRIERQNLNVQELFFNKISSTYALLGFILR